MKIEDILDFLNELSPFELQEKWDNSGLIVGSKDRDLSEIIVSLDIDSSMIKEANEGALFIVHHPLIFGKISTLNFDSYPSNLIEMLIQKRQSLIAMHTNFDKTHLNRYVFEEVLGLRVDKEEEFILEGEANWSLEELKENLKRAFKQEFLRVIAPREHIKRVALTTGSGASLIDRVSADCFLTGDIKYHDAMKAMSEGLMMVDIGHFESEIYFSEVMASKLKTLPISVIIAQSKNPFNTLK